jgi:hypothetical protein
MTLQCYNEFFTGDIMQTFLPIANFKRSLQCLDYRRLGKQRVETFQLLCALDYKPALLERFIRGLPPHGHGWANHPACKMWKGHEHALADYFNQSINEWIKRGFNNTMKTLLVPVEHSYPDWFGDVQFHNSHKSNLLRKNPEYYSTFNWNVKSDLEYIWPAQ